MSEAVSAVIANSTLININRENDHEILTYQGDALAFGVSVENYILRFDKNDPNAWSSTLGMVRAAAKKFEKGVAIELLPEIRQSVRNGLALVENNIDKLYALFPEVKAYIEVLKKNNALQEAYELINEIYGTMALSIVDAYKQANEHFKEQLEEVFKEAPDASELADYFANWLFDTKGLLNTAPELMNMFESKRKLPSHYDFKKVLDLVIPADAGIRMMVVNGKEADLTAKQKQELENFYKVLSLKLEAAEYANAISSPFESFQSWLSETAYSLEKTRHAKTIDNTIAVTPGTMAYTTGNDSPNLGLDNAADYLTLVLKNPDSGATLLFALDSINSDFSIREAIKYFRRQNPDLDDADIKTALIGGRSENDGSFAAKMTEDVLEILKQEGVIVKANALFSKDLPNSYVIPAGKGDITIQSGVPSVRPLYSRYIELIQALEKAIYVNKLHQERDQESNTKGDAIVIATISENIERKSSLSYLQVENAPLEHGFRPYIITPELAQAIVMLLLVDRNKCAVKLEKVGVSHDNIASLVQQVIANDEGSISQLKSSFRTNCIEKPARQLVRSLEQSNKIVSGGDGTNITSIVMPYAVGAGASEINNVVYNAILRNSCGGLPLLETKVTEEYKAANGQEKPANLKVMPAFKPPKAGASLQELLAAPAPKMGFAGALAADKFGFGAAIAEPLTPQKAALDAKASVAAQLILNAPKRLWINHDTVGKLIDAVEQKAYELSSTAGLLDAAQSVAARSKAWLAAR